MSLASGVNSMIVRWHRREEKKRVVAMSTMWKHGRRPPRLLIQELDEEGVSVDDKAKEISTWKHGRQRGDPTNRSCES